MEDEEAFKHRSKSYVDTMASVAPTPEDVLEIEEKKEKEAPTPMVKFSDLYYFATGSEKMLLYYGYLCAFLQGASWPVWSLLFGESITAFDVDENTTISDWKTDFEDDMNFLALSFLVAGVIVGFLVASHEFAFNYIGGKVIARARSKYLASVLRQEIEYHDEFTSAMLDTRLTTNAPKWHAALGSKMGFTVMNGGQCFFGLLIGFALTGDSSWKIMLVGFVALPFIAVSFASFGMFIQSIEAKWAKIYENGARTAREILQLNRTVASFCTQERETKRYDNIIRGARDVGMKEGAKFGFLFGLPDCIVLFLYALVFWYGSHLVRQNELESGDMMTVIFCVLLAFFGLGQIGGTQEIIGKARTSAHTLISVIERESKIDGLSEEGNKDPLGGHIEFEKVDFFYPTNPDTKVLDGLSFSAKSGEVVALVGHSGCGKSTVVSLLERFYDPTNGTILMDGKPLSEINIQHLRKTIGLVTQQPALLPDTIFANIAFGLEGATEEQVVAAAKLANAHDFISSFKDGYNTHVGDLGSQLSGGQRQRIAIARTLIKNPQILLLDEATSALDNKSESIVQEALDKAAKSRTTIVIAHRLSTIRNADSIIVMGHGKILEQGNHEELMKKQGEYYDMITKQSVETETEVHDHHEVSEKTVAVAEEKDGEPGSPTKRESIAEMRELSDKEIAEEKQKRIAQLKKKATGFAWKHAAPETFSLIMSFIGAILVGIVWPLFSIVLSEILNLAMNGSRPTSEADMWSGLLAVGGIIALVGQFQRCLFLFRAGESQTYRSRMMVFSKALKQDASWFDSHSVDHVGTALSLWAAQPRLLVADFWTLFMVIFVTMFGGIAVAFVYCPRMAAVVMAVVPLTAISGMVMGKLLMDNDEGALGNVFADATTYASTVMSNLRTVVSTGRAKAATSAYDGLLKVGSDKTFGTARGIAISAAVSEFVKFGTFGLAFWYGGQIFQDGHCDFTELFTALIGVLFCGIFAGMYAGQLPDLKQAKELTAELMFLLESMDKKKKALPSFEVSQGKIEFRDVGFAYPLRRSNRVLNHFNLTIQPGETVAIVGESGSGKSTLMLLLQKFYNIDSGSILVDGKNIHEIDSDGLRHQTASIAQEPKLFDMTIKDNIVYRNPDDAPKPGMDKVHEAAQLAYAHDFILEQESQYDTPVGELGGKLSGGQRQRVAIAQALFLKENVKILLLDEATSALDVNSEEAVQKSLDEARKGRTTIIVAHRLSTIMNADKIAVLSEGQVAEIGSFDELMKIEGGHFQSLYTRNFAGSAE
eukprot:m.331688 g.331688  ORF g.331688 m.331688 type:complete len:1276 (+) comp16781_c0_seq1:288-4115(+)